MGKSGCPVSEACSMSAQYGAVVTQCCLRRGLGSNSNHGSLSHGGTGKEAGDGVAPLGDADPAEPCWGSLVLAGAVPEKGKL